MNWLLDKIKTFCFWGSLFFLFLLIGFGVEINDFWKEAMAGNIHIKIISIFLLVSPILFILLSILEIYRDVKDGLFFFDSVGTSLLPLFWPIYMLFRRKNFDSTAYVIIMSVLWWGMIAYGVWAIMTIPDNLIIGKILAFDSQQIWIRIGIFVGICFVLFLIALLLWAISGKKMRDMIA